MTFEETLKKALEGMKVPFDDDMIRMMKMHYELMLQENKKVNLTAITSEEDAALKHYADSAALLQAAGLKQGAYLADIGAGAGFPGIPLKILRPDISVCLIESTGKKADFLRLCIAQLGLNECRVVHARSEDAAHDPLLRGRFDAATARAVSKLSVLCELALPLLKKGGRLLAHKGPGARDEMDEARNAMRILGGKEEGIYPAGPEGYRHAIAVISKTGDTPAKYPRKPGTPEKSPL